MTTKTTLILRRALAGGSAALRTMADGTAPRESAAALRRALARLIVAFARTRRKGGRR